MQDRYPKEDLFGTHFYTLFGQGGVEIGIDPCSGRDILKLSYEQIEFIYDSAMAMRKVQEG